MNDSMPTPASTAVSASALERRRGAQTSAERATENPPVGAIAQGLGWFSVGLGLIEVLAPRASLRATGSRADPALVRACGVREIVTGIGLLTARDPAPWLWARVGGDALDIATLASDLDDRNGGRRRTAWTTAPAFSLMSFAII